MQVTEFWLEVSWCYSGANAPFLADGKVPPRGTAYLPREKYLAFLNNLPKSKMFKRLQARLTGTALIESGTAA